MLVTLRDASGRDLRARCLAPFGRLALVDIAREPVDEPHILIVRRFHADESRADGRYKGRQQNGRGDQARADQYWH